MSSAYQLPSLETPPWRDAAASGPVALESHRPLSINDLDLVLQIVRGYVRAGFRLVEAGVIDTLPWITHRAPADQFVDCIPDWLLPGAGVIKGMISFT